MFPFRAASLSPRRVFFASAPILLTAAAIFSGVAFLGTYGVVATLTAVSRDLFKYMCSSHRPFGLTISSLIFGPFCLKRQKKHPEV